MNMHLPKIVRQKKRVGRGIGSRGAKSGRGMKGQKSRAGYHSKAGFEGGQTPLFMRLPKGRGMKQVFASQVVKPAAVPVRHLNRFKDGALIGLTNLREAGLIPREAKAVKLIGQEKVLRKLTIRVHGATPGARASIEAGGGKIEIIPARR